MAAHQHLKTNTHTHPAATNSEAVCLLHKGAAARTPPDSSTRTVITFFRYFHFFDLLLLFFGLFLVLNFFLPTQILQEKWCFCFQARAVQTLQSKSSLVHTELRISLFTHTACRRLTDEAVPRRVSWCETLVLVCVCVWDQTGFLFSSDSGITLKLSLYVCVFVFVFFNFSLASAYLREY